MNWWGITMNDYDIIKKATETYDKNLNAGRYVGDLLRIIKQQHSEINRLRNIVLNAQADIERIIKITNR